MTRAAVKQIDIKRAVAAAQAAGLAVERFEVDSVTGKVTVYAKGASGATGNPWDELHR
jgi:hypothetical protein